MQLSFQPGSRYILRSGTGTGRRALNAFDGALLSAGVGNYNLVKVSSILPPGAQEGSDIPLTAGSLLPIAYGAETTDEPGHRISAAVSIGIPEDARINGVIMEYHSHGSAEDAERIVRDMAEEAMAMRSIKLKEIKSISAEIVSGELPAAAFAAVAIVPLEAY